MRTRKCNIQRQISQCGVNVPADIIAVLGFCSCWTFVGQVVRVFPSVEFAPQQACASHAHDACAALGVVSCAATRHPPVAVAYSRIRLGSQPAPTRRPSPSPAHVCASEQNRLTRRACVCFRDILFLDLASASPSAASKTAAPAAVGPYANARRHREHAAQQSGARKAGRRRSPAVAWSVAHSGSLCPVTHVPGHYCPNPLWHVLVAAE